MKEIKNIRELTADLGRLIAELRAREIETKEASEIANIAGKIINGAKAEMMYRIARRRSRRYLFSMPMANNFADSK